MVTQAKVENKFSPNPLEKYLVERIRPIYESFDRCHDERHYDEVMKAMHDYLMLDEVFDKDAKESWVYYAMIVTAAYHDIGRMVSDAEHEFYSTMILRRDRKLIGILLDLAGPDNTQIILKESEFAIMSHREDKDLSNSELSKMLKDADQVSIWDKSRCAYRIVAYRVDHGYSTKDEKEFCTDAMKYINEENAKRFRHSNGAMLKHKGESVPIITYDDIQAAYDRLTLESQ